MPDLFADSDNQFLDRARYAKGRKTLQAILNAAYDLIIAEGPTAASQKAIAERANVSQSAVRHYFPTKEDLLVAFFSTGIERVQSLLRSKTAEFADDPRAQLLESARLQYRSVGLVDDIFFFEATAFWRRNPDYSKARDEWYDELNRYYRELITRIHPRWDEIRCADTAFQVLTLILGAWITAGRTRTLQQGSVDHAQTEVLLRGIERLID